MFAKTSPTGFHVLGRLRQAEARVEHLEARLDAFIRESNRPDVHPDYRFRVACPDGIVRWRPTREAAEALLLELTL